MLKWIWLDCKESYIPIALSAMRRNTGKKQEKVVIVREAYNNWRIFSPASFLNRVQHLHKITTGVYWMYTRRWKNNWITFCSYRINMGGKIIPWRRPFQVLLFQSGWISIRVLGLCKKLKVGFRVGIHSEINSVTSFEYLRKIFGRVSSECWFFQTTRSEWWPPPPSLKVLV